jgi:hypothetical protein
MYGDTLELKRPNAGDIILKPVIFRSDKPVIQELNPSVGKKGDLVFRSVHGRSNGFYANNFVIITDTAGKGIVLFTDPIVSKVEWYALEVVFAGDSFGRAVMSTVVTKEALIDYYTHIKATGDDTTIEQYINY